MHSWCGRGVKVTTGKQATVLDREEVKCSMEERGAFRIESLTLEDGGRNGGGSEPVHRWSDPLRDLEPSRRWLGRLGGGNGSVPGPRHPGDRSRLRRRPGR